MRWQTDQNQRVKVSFLAAVLAASSGSVLATDLNIADGTVSDKTYTDIVQIFGNKTERSLTLSNVSVSTDETSILVAAQSGSSFTINGASQITSANSAAVVFGNGTEGGVNINTVTIGDESSSNVDSQRCGGIELFVHRRA